MPMLEHRPLGHSGIEVPVLGLGCNNFGHRLDLAGTRAVIDACEERGVTFLDTADVYGATNSESFLGEALKGRRERFVLATKFGMDAGEGADDGPRGSAQYIRGAIERSLRRLQTDHVDLYWYHRPDGVTAIEETLGALDELVRAGKVRAIGASNFTAEQIEAAQQAAAENGLHAFCAIQNEYSLLVRDPESNGVLDACERHQLGFVPYFPLASGLLTGKYRRGERGPEGARLSGRDRIASEEQWEALEALSGFAEERGVPLTSVAIGTLLARSPVCSVIAGATKPEQVASNADAAQWRPSGAELEELEQLLSAARLTP
jgi:aryl-alcohol dehydrogenase-like predicted oxidoreductase